MPILEEQLVTKTFDRRDAWMPAEAPFESAGVGRPATRPNIVIVLADDLGYGELSCSGNAGAITPNLDRFAGEGLRLTDCHSASSCCSPSRAAILTGQTP